MMGSQGMLNVDDGGVGGLPVVFVHSSAGNTTHWAAQLAHLRKRRRAVALDLRGHGKSELPRDGGFSVEDFAQDVGSVVEGLGLQRFVLVGHSLGGAVCVAYAGAHPERVAGLFLLDPASDGRMIPEEQAQGWMGVLATEAWSAVVEEAWAPMLAPSRPEVRERVLAEMRATSQASVRGGLGALLTFDPVAPLRAYRGPRLSVVTAFNEDPGSYHRLVPALPHEKVEGTGHWVQLDAPDTVNALLDGFLSTVR
ncbi:Menaquinone biosynthesis related protein, putative DHNA-CoA thioesterase [Myxococcus hansupus]|uniref:Menaquinone biosynthesis related protein, putative DHNA-CoA thioesterase n=1 Tax=Pseudomyxococcus hansupus TaxID=1297742 RepID=A0A0H4WNI1_9BACT|nr:alpha/beta hydrolase [Myxococcus hansupus]AKQ64986.1 Menaquinone biosynthesis related protein, putative DHNA-CoA thioesterase [Myxococcus hansupus]